MYLNKEKVQYKRLDLRWVFRGTIVYVTAIDSKGYRLAAPKIVHPVRES